MLVQQDDLPKLQDTILLYLSQDHQGVRPLQSGSSPGEYNMQLSFAWLIHSAALDAG